MNSRHVLLVGATSDMAVATARRYAERGWRVTLAGRNPERLNREADDLRARHDVPISVVALDVAHTATLPSALAALPLPDTAVSFVGDLGDQAQAQADPAAAERLFRANFTGPALVFSILAEAMQRRGSGTLVGVSSVAGDRGRASNYVYGSAKAGFTAFLSGLRNRLANSGVRVVTVKPGFVRTKMTADMKLPPIVTAEPKEVAAAIWRAAEEGRGDVLYVRPVWRLIMLVIQTLPEPVFKRLKL